MAVEPSREMPRATPPSEVATLSGARSAIDVLRGRTGVIDEFLESSAAAFATWRPVSSTGSPFESSSSNVGCINDVLGKTPVWAARVVVNVASRRPIGSMTVSFPLP